MTRDSTHSTYSRVRPTRARIQCLPEMRAMRAETRSDLGLSPNKLGSRAMTERELLDAVRAACKWSGLLVHHTFDSRRSEPGYPDLCICGPRGVLFRELKAERGRLTADQRRWLDRLRAAGADADVWRPADWPTRVFAELAAIGGRCLLYEPTSTLERTHR